MLRNYYELLKVGYDAAPDMIKKAYRDRMKLCSDDNLAEKYRTAYYNLFDSKRRHNYDISIGIHKYKKVSRLKRVAKTLAAFFLTLLDSLLSFWWCFALALIAIAIAYDYYNNKNFDLIRIFLKYEDESRILFLCSLIDLVIHFYVRRANRYLKNFNWEVSNEYDYGGNNDKKRTRWTGKK